MNVFEMFGDFLGDLSIQLESVSVYARSLCPSVRRFSSFHSAIMRPGQIWGGQERLGQYFPDESPLIQRNCVLETAWDIPGKVTRQTNFLVVMCESYDHFEEKKMRLESCTTNLERLCALYSSPWRYMKLYRGPYLPSLHGLYIAGNSSLSTAMDDWEPRSTWERQ